MRAHEFITEIVYTHADEGVAEGDVVPFKKPKTDLEKYSDAFSKQSNDTHRYGVGEIECEYCGSVDCDYDCDGSQADGQLEESITEAWSKKYKKSINCNNPKGFSQRAHCAGRKKRKTSEDIQLDEEYSWVIRHKETKRVIGTFKDQNAAIEQFNSIRPKKRDQYVVVSVPKRHSDLDENFADGKKPGRKGLAKRSGVNCKQSVTKLRKVAKNSTGEKSRMASWCANMKAGRNK